MPEPNEALELTRLVVHSIDAATNAVTFASGNRYEGDYVNGYLHGRGKYTWADGTSFTGTFRKNRITGEGEYQWRDGTCYSGGVKQGIRQGHGTVTKPGCRYVGDIVDGMPHGHGVMTAVKGTYDGEWAHGVMHGQGVMRYATGNHYTGQWRHGKRHGQGQMTWAKRHEFYDGAWRDGLPHGYGYYRWTIPHINRCRLTYDDEYWGEWQNGKRHGACRMRYADSRVFVGRYENDWKQGPFLCWWPSCRELALEFNQDQLITKMPPDLAMGFIDQRLVIDDISYPLLVEVNAAFSSSQHRLLPVFAHLAANGPVYLTSLHNLMHRAAIVDPRLRPMSEVPLNRAIAANFRKSQVMNERYQNPHRCAVAYSHWDFMRVLYHHYSLVATPGYMSFREFLDATTDAIEANLKHWVVHGTDLTSFHAWYASLAETFTRKWLAVFEERWHIVASYHPRRLADSENDRTMTLREAYAVQYLARRHFNALMYPELESLAALKLFDLGTVHIPRRFDLEKERAYLMEISGSQFMYLILDFAIVFQHWWMLCNVVIPAFDDVPPDIARFAAAMEEHVRNSARAEQLRLTVEAERAAAASASSAHTAADDFDRRDPLASIRDKDGPKDSTAVRDSAVAPAPATVASSGLTGGSSSNTAATAVSTPGASAAGGSAAAVSSPGKDREARTLAPAAKPSKPRSRSRDQLVEPAGAAGARPSSRTATAALTAATSPAGTAGAAAGASLASASASASAGAPGCLTPSAAGLNLSSTGLGPTRGTSLNPIPAPVAPLVPGVAVNTNELLVGDQANSPYTEYVADYVGATSATWPENREERLLMAREILLTTADRLVEHNLAFWALREKLSTTNRNNMDAGRGDF